MSEVDDLNNRAKQLRKEATDKIRQAEEIEKKAAEAQEAIERAQRIASGGQF